jgi:nucleoside-diphosphate-sugar epimerase
MGWQARIPLEDGLRSTYQWYLARQGSLRGEAA